MYIPDKWSLKQSGKMREKTSQINKCTKMLFESHKILTIDSSAKKENSSTDCYKTDLSMLVV